MEEIEALIPGSSMIQDYALTFWHWLQHEVITIHALVQISAILFLLLLASRLGKKTSHWVEENTRQVRRLSFIRFYASYQEMTSIVYSIGFLWGAVLVAQSAGLPYKILHTAASLLFAWGIIRFTSSTIQSLFWSRIIAVTLWTLAALNILDWLAPTINLLDEAGITIGETRLSLLILIKSFIAFGILLWAVNVLSNTLERAFQRSDSLTPSQRVLFFKISNILLFAVAGVIGLNIVGLDLTALTVFSGALGLGIGFGLQKIFSNLVSGIILLLDKSVKPGDVVAIGDTFGWVNSLSARCVSVITRDGKEHLIPNENLITQEVENWSYSDMNVRIHIPVGVSYSSDMKLVRQLLEEAVKSHPRILDYPAPAVFITGFGDSSVDHEIRCWINDPQNGITNVKSDIFYRIWDAFQEHGVEIPFPQRDVHIKHGTLQNAT